MSSASGSRPRSRAVLLEEFGRTPSVTQFELDRPEPGGLTVACRYGGVCGTDLHLIRGDLDVPLPLVLGHEGLGVVHELGATDTRDVQGRLLAVGDVVMWASSIACHECFSCQVLREPTLCENRRTYGVNRSVADGSPLAGSWAEHIQLHPGTTVIALPPDVNAIAAMALACAGPTMVHALWERRPVRVGETVVVQGSGPVGVAAAALAALAGARVIMVGGPQSRLDLIKRGGFAEECFEVVESGDVDAARDGVFAATDGRGADLVIECTGVPDAIDQGTRMARRGGSYLVVGQYTDAGNVSFNPHQIVHRQLDVVGSWAFTGAHLLDYIRLLPALTDRFDLQALVTQYPLDDVAAALLAAREGTSMKIVLTP